MSRKLNLYNKYNKNSRKFSSIKSIKSKSSLDSSMFERLNVLGEGNFGTAYRVLIPTNTNIKYKNVKNNCIIIAVEKTVKTNTKDYNRGVKELYKEASLMKSLEKIKPKFGINICKMIGFDYKTNSLFLEMYPKGDLKKYLIKHDISNKLKLKFAREIANGMIGLHSISIIHRDLAARNVLLDSNLICKIADFGLSRLLENKYMKGGGEDVYYKTRSGVFPIKWTAPEAIITRKFTKNTDIWSYGITLWEIYSNGSTPYKDILNNEIIGYINSFRYEQKYAPIEELDKIPKKINNLIKECLYFNKNKRPDFIKIKDVLKKIN